VPRDPETTNNVFPHKVLHLVGLCNWLSLYPLCEVLNGYHEVLSSDELTKEKDLRCLFPMYGEVRGYILTVTPQVAHDANQHASDIVRMIVRVSYNPLHS